MKNTSTPLVSIHCLTYNHAPYIRECLDGFLMQKTNFSIEVLIHDDASTDGTADIIREYEAKYPDIIKPIYQTENQYSKGVKVSATFNFPRAKGKYIAICEGDDYWTDPLKLQKQVDFLESHPDYVMCSHRFKRYIQEKSIFMPDGYGNLKNSIDYDWNEFVKFEEEYTQTLTLMFKKMALVGYEEYENTRDRTLVYILLKKGKGRMLLDNMGVYRIHSLGVWSGVSFLDNRTSDIKVCLGIYQKEKTAESARMLYNRLSRCKYLGYKYIIRNINILTLSVFIIAKYFGIKESMYLCFRWLNYFNRS